MPYTICYNVGLQKEEPFSDRLSPLTGKSPSYVDFLWGISWHFIDVGEWQTEIGYTLFSAMDLLPKNHPAMALWKFHPAMQHK